MIKQIYRYQSDILFNEELTRFVKNNQNADRKDFKQAWIRWREEKDELFQIEIKKYKELNYQGDIEDKIFKSARYYFRKKLLNPNDKNNTNNTNVQEIKATNHYINVNKELLEIMDGYIQKHIDMKPSNSFIQFCDENKEIIKKEIMFLYEIQNIKTSNEIREKIKKTYKNRYYYILNKKNDCVKNDCVKNDC